MHVGRTILSIAMLDVSCTNSESDKMLVGFAEHLLAIHHKLTKVGDAGCRRQQYS